MIPSTPILKISKYYKNIFKVKKNYDNNSSDHVKSAYSNFVLHTVLKYFMILYHLIFAVILLIYHFHYTDEEIEAQRGSVTCPKLKKPGSGPNPGLLAWEAIILILPKGRHNSNRF